MAWFRRQKKGIERAASEESKVRTEGLWQKCDGCRQIVWKKDLDANLSVCPRCQHHYRINARQRLELLFDAGGYTEHDAGLAHVGSGGEGEISITTVFEQNGQLVAEQLRDLGKFDDLRSRSEHDGDRSSAHLV